MVGDLARDRRRRGFGLGRAVLFWYNYPGPRRAIGPDVLPALRIGTQRRTANGHRPDRIRGHLPDRKRPRLAPRIAWGMGTARSIIHDSSRHGTVYVRAL